MEKSSKRVVSTATAHAFANLALVKYFGKRDLVLNLPAAPSLSITLDPLTTVTTISFDEMLDTDEFILNGSPPNRVFCERVSGFLDIARRMAGVETRASVTTRNDFPTAAGLASSASGFAALALVATRALGLALDDMALSALARRGSGSGARSIPGGLSVWHMGEKPDGSDSFATSIAGPEAVDIRVLVGVTDPGPKAIGSTAAMEQTRLTSPYYDRWIETVHRDMKAALSAVASRDFVALGEVVESNALAMHAAALSARPGILFWNGTTVEAVHLCRRLRKEGCKAYFTCDAGPQPKLLCREEDELHTAEALAKLPGVTRIIHCRPGGGAALE